MSESRGGVEGLCEGKNLAEVVAFARAREGEPLKRLRRTVPKSIIGSLPRQHAESLQFDVPYPDSWVRYVTLFPVVF